MKKKWIGALSIFTTLFAAAFVVDTVQPRNYYGPMLTGEEMGEMPLEQLSTSPSSTMVLPIAPFQPREYIRIHSNKTNE